MKQPNLNKITGINQDHRIHHYNKTTRQDDQTKKEIVKTKTLIRSTETVLIVKEKVI